MLNMKRWQVAEYAGVVDGITPAVLEAFIARLFSRWVGEAYGVKAACLLVLHILQCWGPSLPGCSRGGCGPYGVKGSVLNSPADLAVLGAFVARLFSR